MPRPKYAPRPDTNHNIVTDYARDRCGGFTPAPKDVIARENAYTFNFRGYGITLTDMSKDGGTKTDYLMECPEVWRYVWVEVKTAEAYKKANNDLTDGEKWRSENSVTRIVVTENDVEKMLEWLVGWLE